MSKAQQAPPLTLATGVDPSAPSPHAAARPVSSEARHPITATAIGGAMLATCAINALGWATIYMALPPDAAPWLRLSAAVVAGLMIAASIVSEIAAARFPVHCADALAANARPNAVAALGICAAGILFNAVSLHHALDVVGREFARAGGLPIDNLVAVLAVIVLESLKVGGFWVLSWQRFGQQTGHPVPLPTPDTVANMNPRPASPSFSPATGRSGGRMARAAGTVIAVGLAGMGPGHAANATGAPASETVASPARANPANDPATSRETAKARARDLLAGGSMSVREISRQTGLHHDTIKRLAEMQAA